MIRPAQPTDAPQMAEVLSNWIDETPWMPRIHTRAEDFKFCQQLFGETEVWVVDTKNGFGFLARHKESIDALYLGPNLRRQGWGAALLDAVRIDRTALSLWTFQSNAGALAFYEANGFHISDVTNGDGNAEKLPDCRMIWTRGE